MDGVVVIDKPRGMTSHDVVDRVRKVFGTRKVGHAGTLDPDATGVLVVGVGKATRFLSYSQDAPKSYRAVARFGVSTSTQDASGDVLSERPATFDRDALATALEDLTGEIRQIPPMVSAVKIGGERLYEKARRGEDVERPARRVTVYSLELVEFDPSPQDDPAHPRAIFDVTCSAGTFVRTIAHDTGEALGCGAHLVSLVRTEAGGFSLGDAVALDDLETSHLLPLAEAVRPLPAIEADAAMTTDVSHGRALAVTDLEVASGPVAIVRSGELLGVYRAEGDRLVAERVVPS